MATSKDTVLGSHDFQTEDELTDWMKASIDLMLKVSREFEDASALLKAKLAVTPVVNSSKNDYDFRKENKVRANQVGKAISRAGTAIQGARNDVAAAHQIFLQHWTKDGGLASTTGTNKNEGIKLNGEKTTRSRSNNRSTRSA